MSIIKNINEIIFKKYKIKLIESNYFVVKI